MHHVDAHRLADGWLACVDGWTTHDLTGEGGER
jgi:hypothetical protein